MATIKSFRSAIEEARGRLVKKIVVRDGKKQVLHYREYATDCKDGYKRDPDTGTCVRMSSKERLARSRAALKSQNKSATKRRRAISMKRRSALVQ